MEKFTVDNYYQPLKKILKVSLKINQNIFRE